MNSIQNTIEQEKIIVIVRGIPYEKLLPLCQAMYDGGIRLLEITYSADGKISDEETAMYIRKLSEEFRGRMYIGAGTVLTKKQVELTWKAGGSFIISPDTNPEIIKKTKEFGMISIPGAFTPTEIQLAHRSGADFVKLFPVTSLGAEYVKAVTAPLSHIKLLAVGGITEANIADYLNVGVAGFGISSNIIDKKAVADNDFHRITELANKYVSAVRG